MTRKVMPLLFLVLLGLLADTRPATALDCFWNLRDCYSRASREGSYADMWLRGLDCEVTWTSCLREAFF